MAIYPEKKKIESPRKTWEQQEAGIVSYQQE